MTARCKSTLFAPRDGQWIVLQTHAGEVEACWRTYYGASADGNRYGPGWYSGRGTDMQYVDPADVLGWKHKEYAL